MMIVPEMQVICVEKIHQRSYFMRNSAVKGQNITIDTELCASAKTKLSSSVFFENIFVMEKLTVQRDKMRSVAVEGMTLNVERTTIRVFQNLMYVMVKFSVQMVQMKIIVKTVAGLLVKITISAGVAILNVYTWSKCAMGGSSVQTRTMKGTVIHVHILVGTNAPVIIQNVYHKNECVKYLKLHYAQIVMNQVHVRSPVHHIRYNVDQKENAWIGNCSVTIQTICVKVQT